jgi:hypothetical protein
VIALPITEASAKLRTGGPVDDDEDLSVPCWAGHLPVALQPAPLVPFDAAARRYDPPRIPQLE